MEPHLLALIRELEEEGTPVARLCAAALKELHSQVDTQNQHINAIVHRMNTGRVDE